MQGTPQRQPIIYWPHLCGRSKFQSNIRSPALFEILMKHPDHARNIGANHKQHQKQQLLIYFLFRWKSSAHLQASRRIPNCSCTFSPDGNLPHICKLLDSASALQPSRSTRPTPMRQKEYQIRYPQSCCLQNPDQAHRPCKEHLQGTAQRQLIIYWPHLCGRSNFKSNNRSPAAIKTMMK